MSRSAALALLLLLPALALAQPPAGGAPAGPATLSGRVVRESGEGSLAGLTVVLYAPSEEGEPGLARTETDAEGRFRFEGISNEPARLYLVGVRVGELPWGTSVRFAKGETRREVELRVSEPTADASGVERAGAVLRLDRGCGGLAVEETWRLRNRGPRPVLVPEAQRGAQAPLFEAPLPAGASALSVPVGEQGLEERDGRVRFYGPLQPGEQELSFGYSLPAPAGAPLRFAFPALTGHVAVRTAEGGPRVSGPGLEPGAPVELDGRRYASASAAPSAADGALELRVELPEEAPAPVALDAAQLFLELDDAALVVDAYYRLSVPGGEALAARADAPLLCLPLPEGAEGLRFSPETLAMGALPDPSGELALRGPIPAGESSVAMRFHLPVSGDAADLAPRFARRLPLLAVFVADNGVAVETTRLHRRRPMQTEDRSYLHLEGFELEPGEAVPIRVARIAPERALPRAASAGFSLALAAAGIALLVAPLRGRDEEAGPDPEALALETERASVRAALASLEEDFETGKLDAADYEALRAELRARTAALIERRRGGPPRPPAAPGATRCAACAAELPADARFCHRCGTSLGARGERAR